MRQQQASAINAQQQQQAAVAAKAALHTGPEHAANLERLTGIQKRRVKIGIQGTPAQFADAAGQATTAKLSRTFVNSMKRPTTMQNRHKARGSQLAGNPETVVIKSIRVCHGYNGTTKDLSVDIDGIFPTSGNAAHLPCAVNLPRTGIEGRAYNDYVLKEPANKMSDKMLKFQGLLRNAEHEITVNARPDATHWHVETRDPSTGLPTFSVALLKDMIDDGMWEGAEKISAGIDAGLKDPEVDQLSLPRPMLEKVRNEVINGKKELKASMVNLYEWSVHFRPDDGSSWTDPGVTQGANIGNDINTVRKAARKRNQIPAAAWIEIEMEYGMLL